MGDTSYNDIRRDLDTDSLEQEHVLMNFIHNSIPRYSSSRERMHTMFVKKCVSPVSSYQTCLSNNKW